MSKDLLIDVGVEELPSSYMDELANLLSISFSSFLDENYISRSGEEIFLTPRRMIFTAKDMALKQNIPEKEIKGPPKNIALTEDGSPTKALTKFLEKCNTDKWYVKTTKEGEYIFCSTAQENLETRTIIENKFPTFLLNLPYSKKMRWDGIIFIRPIRWIVSLLGEDLINLEICGVKSSRIEKGLRGYPEISIENASNYKELMANNRVIISSTDRMNMIKERLSSFNENTLIENVNITEFPVCVDGKFEKDFLMLPGIVISTVLAKSLKSFTINDNKGALTNEFVFVMDGPRNTEVVRAGYEKVVNAKLKDALYFFELDKKKKLDERREALSGIIFIEKLGTISQKIDRMKILSTLFDEIIQRDKLIRTIDLSKVDLTTKLVYEFPELQGAMGKIYALEEGIEPEIANSLYEYYLPIYESDKVPESILSRVLGIIDRTDTFIGALWTGIDITGSYDPLGVRRAVIGLIRILLYSYIPIDILSLFRTSMEAYRRINNIEFEDNFISKLIDFYNIRLKNILASTLKYDVVNALINESLIVNPFELKVKGEIIEKEREKPEFKTLCESYTRINNILKGTKIKSEGVIQELFTDPAEMNLYKAYLEVKNDYFKSNDYLEKINLLYKINEPVTSFFDNVLVMTENLETRENRLALLSKIKKLLSDFAEFSKIVF
ncbi:MAG TPA: glycine--tRNA ligase subunit beta [Caldisericia bacterium]|nr:glycine--tRNA ligase subunit beta [Caldisericia bacterium]